MGGSRPPGPPGGGGPGMRPQGNYPGQQPMRGPNPNQLSSQMGGMNISGPRPGPVSHCINFGLSATIACKMREIETKALDAWICLFFWQQ